jgi:tetratricopeptide (TPR) repeat protein
MTRTRDRSRTIAALGGVAALGIVAIALFTGRPTPPPPAPGAEPPAPLAGSQSCRSCHAVFFQKWSTSFHGLAMQPHTGDFARDRLTPQEKPLAIGGRSYRAVVGTGSDHVEETGPAGTKTHPIVQVLGGKNVCYFLTPLERGLLQVLPVAYDTNRKEWFSTAGSAVRHFAGVTDEELDWTDRAYTFNTSCFSCHVSQLATNYEPETDSYRTVWAEPGVSCETCHGPAGEHVKAFEGLAPGVTPKDWKIVSVKTLSKEQRSDLCASCHAKASPLWTAFRPGDRFFDHFDLTTLESLDYHPDGRDLGENYTFTSWRQSPCVKSGRIDCVHCHTSSGRYKFKDRPNDACLPCHEGRVKTAAAHTRHPGDGPGTRCTDCHMPMTEFARMRRSDHSMRPPAPAATRQLGSPNACNVCHAGRDPAWAEQALRAWGGSGRWSERILREGRLVAAARKGDWSRLPEMLRYLGEPGRDEVVTASLVRLLAGCEDGSKWPALRAVAADPSPLVRAAAVTALEGDPGARDLVLAATRDDNRLVRVRAAAALGAVDLATVNEPSRTPLVAARGELERSLLARPDDFASQYNLGNLHLERGDPAAAADRYRKAVALRPDHVASLVNLSMAEARLGRLGEAEAALREATRVQPREASAHFNLGLLLAERQRPVEARDALRRALELDPANAAAAYNLAVLVAESPKEAASLAGRAAGIAPQDPRYAFTQAFYLEKAGDAAGAERVLRALVGRHPGYRDGWAFLGVLLEGRGRAAEAAEVYRRAAETAALPAADRAAFDARSRARR